MILFQTFKKIRVVSILLNNNRKQTAHHAPERLKTQISTTRLCATHERARRTQKTQQKRHYINIITHNFLRAVYFRVAK